MKPKLTGQKSHIGRYWDKHLMSWESGAYPEDEIVHSAGLWDRLSSLFRKDRVAQRMDALMDLLTPYIPGMSILDIGCASGRLAVKLIKQGASHVTGIDVASSAIEIAERRGKKEGMESNLDFFEADVTLPDIELPQVDIVTALGVIEYFDRQSLDNFLSNLKAKHFLFHVPLTKEKGKGKVSFLRRIYLIFNRCPGVYLYTLEEFTEIAGRHGYTDLRVIKKFATFITNLPEKAT
ncbi:methyltransferase domain-containing protein [Acidobacteriota bacterium]